MSKKWPIFGIFFLFAVNASASEVSKSDANTKYAEVLEAGDELLESDPCILHSSNLRDEHLRKLPKTSDLPLWETSYGVKASSFDVKGSPRAIIVLLKKTFDGMTAIKVDLKPYYGKKAEVNGFANGPILRCNFGTRLYRKSKGEDLMCCEFYRISGCISIFNKLINEVCIRLKIASPQKDFDQFTLPMPVGRTKCDDMDFDPVFAMMKDERLDVQQEGAISLAAMTQTNNVGHNLSKLLPVLRNIIDEAHDDNLRYVIIAIENICQFEADCRAPIIESLGKSMIQQLGNPSYYYSLDTKRHLTRVLIYCGIPVR